MTAIENEYKITQGMRKDRHEPRVPEGHQHKDESAKETEKDTQAVEEPEEPMEGTISKEKVLLRFKLPTL